MRLTYLLLSPTFGMHQYGSDPANAMTAAGHDVHLVTTTHYPRDRYSPAVIPHTPIQTTNTGFSTESLHLNQLLNVQRSTLNLQPDVVHFTGPHLWNIPLLWWLRRAGIPTVHTIHDLDPHTGTSRLLHLWNRAVIRLADHILVHGACYRQRLLDMDVPPDKVTYTPVLHLFLNHAGYTQAASCFLPPASCPLPPASESPISKFQPSYEPWALFFGRLEPYKGVEHLIRAATSLDGTGDGPSVVLAGRGSLQGLWPGPLPSNVELRDHLIGDEEALDLFRRCSLLVLPYTAATQSALIAAAYFFRKPVLVTRSGALPEYVVDGQTGWVVEPGDPTALSERLAEALSDPARLARMGQAGRDWYDQQRKVEWETLERMYRHVQKSTQ